MKWFNVPHGAQGNVYLREPKTSPFVQPEPVAAPVVALPPRGGARKNTRRSATTTPENQVSYSALVKRNADFLEKWKFADHLLK